MKKCNNSEEKRHLQQHEESGEYKTKEKGIKTKEK
jgi:hypothetical protein